MEAPSQLVRWLVLQLATMDNLTELHRHLHADLAMHVLATALVQELMVHCAANVMLPHLRRAALRGPSTVQPDGTQRPGRDRSSRRQPATTAYLPPRSLVDTYWKDEATPPTAGGGHGSHNGGGLGEGYGDDTNRGDGPPPTPEERAIVEAFLCAFPAELGKAAVKELRTLVFK